MNFGFKKAFIFILTAAVFGSCLKTNDLYEGFEDIKPIADIPLSRLSSDTLTAYALNVASSPDATIDTQIAVHLSAKEHVGNVTFQMGLATDDTAFQRYMINHPDLTLMPTNLYSFDSSVTIENAGVLNTATFPIRFKTGAIDADSNNLFLSNSYVLPIKIKDAGGYEIASNFRMIVLRVLAKNAYDADYQVTGWFFHPSAGRAIDLVKHMSSIGATSVETGLGDLGSPIDLDVVNNATVVWLRGPYTGTGGSNGFMTEDNPAGVDYAASASNQGHVPGDADFNSTIYNNTYDPATQTFYLHYGYNATNPAGQGVYTRQIYEKWVRIN